MEKVLSLKHEASIPTQAHTTATIVRDASGRVLLALECFRPRCGCVGYHSLEELIKIMQELQASGERKEAA